MLLWLGFVVEGEVGWVVEGEGWGVLGVERLGEFG
jgi:hypothetical protein